MKIFEFVDYKPYLTQKIAELPKKGRGEFQKLAKLLGVHSTMISHVFKGNAHLSVEQGLKVACHFGLNALETDYFVNMIQIERAGDKPTQEYFRLQLSKLRERFEDLSQRLDTKKVLVESDRAVFYSQWYYLAIQILTSIEGYQDPQSISQYLRIPIGPVLEALDFLVATGLCRRDGDKYRVGITRTYLERSSPLVSRHHSNWRFRVLQQFPDIQKDELVFTCPTSISKQDFRLVRERLAEFISEFDTIIAPSKDETFACLNIDWVAVR